MPTVTSSDGTTIAYDIAGSGPVIVFVPGALNDRSICAPLAEALKDRYTVVCMDRRGRGDSTDAIAPADVASYTVAHEIADLDAVIAAVGGEAMVFGFSAGAILALGAAAKGSAISRLAMYEPPFAIGDDNAPAKDGLVEKLIDLVVAGRTSDAVATMQIDGIGLQPRFVTQLQRMPKWARLESIAQSTVYDATIAKPPNVPTPEMAQAPVEVLVLAGSGTWPELRKAAVTLPEYLPKARYVELLGGANHTIPVEATANVLREFFS